MTETHVVTLSRHIVEEERRFPDATGRFSDILLDIALAAKIVSREVNKAGLVDVLGGIGEVNVHGEDVQKLDVFADQVFINAMDHTGNLWCMASEEHPEIIPIPSRFPKGEYVLLFDPLDGSSNIDVNISVGSIFSILRRVGNGPDGTLKDCLQPGSRQLAAGYVLYGSATMLVYTVGAGVHGFTLDPSIGEFLLSHPDIRMPEPPARVYSVNEAYAGRWSDGQRAFLEHLKGGEHGSFSARYVGSLVADFHRTLLRGGLFMYPADSKHTSGKLRLLYEGAPMAFIASQAGGRASDGVRDILTVQPRALHERTPLYVGSKSLVDLAERFLADS